MIEPKAHTWRDRTGIGETRTKIDETRKPVADGGRKSVSSIVRIRGLVSPIMGIVRESRLPCFTTNAHSRIQLKGPRS
jgi:hypothetical protein